MAPTKSKDGTMNTFEITFYYKGSANDSKKYKLIVPGECLEEAITKIIEISYTITSVEKKEYIPDYSPVA